MAKKMEWMPSAFANVKLDAWRKKPADWIVTDEAGQPFLDGYKVFSHKDDEGADQFLQVDPEPLTIGQMINFDNRPAGKPNELVEYITHVWTDDGLVLNEGTA